MRGAPWALSSPSRRPPAGRASRRQVRALGVPGPDPRTGRTRVRARCGDSACMASRGGRERDDRTWATQRREPRPVTALIGLTSLKSQLCTAAPNVSQRSTPAPRRGEGCLMRHCPGCPGPYRAGSGHTRDLPAQGFDRLLPRERTASAALGRRPAATGVHSVDLRAVEAVVHQPLRRWRPRLRTPAPFCLTSLFRGDPAVGLGEGRCRLLGHRVPGEAEQLKPGQPLGHSFDYKAVLLISSLPCGGTGGPMQADSGSPPAAARPFLLLLPRPASGAAVCRRAARARAVRCRYSDRPAVPHGPAGVACGTGDCGLPPPHHPNFPSHRTATTALCPSKIKPLPTGAFSAQRFRHRPSLISVPAGSAPRACAGLVGAPAALW